MRKLWGGLASLLIALVINQLSAHLGFEWGIKAASAVVLIAYGLLFTSPQAKVLWTYSAGGSWGRKMGMILLAGLITGAVGSFSAWLYISAAEKSAQKSAVPIAAQKADQQAPQLPQTTAELEAHIREQAPEKSAAPATAQKPGQSAPQLPQTTAELEAHLREQTSFLLRSSIYYDAGDENEAKRIATSLHILLKDSPNQYSLLTMLRIKDSLLFANSVDPDVPGNISPYAGLAEMELSGRGTKYVPRLGFEDLYVPGSPPRDRYESFDEWWSAIVLDDKRGSKLTRGELIVAVAEQDGGVAVSSELDSNYAELSRRNSRWWREFDGKSVKANYQIPFLELATIRAIGWEVLQSIQRQYPQYAPTLYERLKNDFKFLPSWKADFSLTHMSGTELKGSEVFYFDPRSKTKFIGFYLPQSDYTYRLCIHLAHRNAAPEVVAAAAPPAEVIGGSPASEFSYTRRVYIYHESRLAAGEPEKLESEFRAAGLVLHLVGPEE